MEEIRKENGTENKQEETKEDVPKTGVMLSDDELDGISGGVSLQHITHPLGMGPVP